MYFSQKLPEARSFFFVLFCFTSPLRVFCYSLVPKCIAYNLSFFLCVPWSKVFLKNVISQGAISSCFYGTQSILSCTSFSQCTYHFLPLKTKIQHKRAQKLTAKGAKLGGLAAKRLELKQKHSVRYLLTAGANLAEPPSINSYRNIFYDDSSATEGVL